MIKAVKIHQTIDEFLEEHPELKVVERDTNGNIIALEFPSDATNTSFTNFYGIIKIYYNYHGESIMFPDYWFCFTKTKRDICLI